MAATAYPESFPSAEATALVVAALRGEGVNPKKAARAVWLMAGYALGQWDAGPAEPAAWAPGGEPFDRAAAADAIEALSGTGKKARAQGASRLPWGRLLPILLQLLQELLSKGE